MKPTIAIALASLASAAPALAGTIDYTLTGRISVIAGIDTDGLNGAQFTYRATFDDNSLYVNRFGLAAAVAISGSTFIEITGSSIAANNGISATGVDMAFYPTFAGNFMDPSGLRLQFTLGNGSQFSMIGNTTPAPGSASATIGSDVKRNDFVPAAYFGSNGGRALTNETTGTRYTFLDVSITAIPAPGTVAPLALVTLLASRRRR
ncbi:MAG: hypothetical protein KF902_00740 [Phycisphaeraceae bacterium]|nr:hypothetical protein [Phycisphaeraceae bacterium]